MGFTVYGWHNNNFSFIDLVVFFALGSLRLKCVLFMWVKHKLPLLKTIIPLPIYCIYIYTYIVVVSHLGMADILITIPFYWSSQYNEIEKIFISSRVFVDL